MSSPTRLLLICAAGLAIAAAPSTAGHLAPIDARHSTMTVYVYKEGIFAFAADNHEIDAPIAKGSYDDTRGSVSVTIDAAKMRVLDLKMPADRRAKVQSNMVGADVLDVAKYPRISFQSTKIIRSDAHWTVVGDLTLHGQTHPVEVKVTRTDATHFSGAAVVKQTSFGIAPIRIAGGTVRVKDDVKVVFEIAL